MSILALDGVLPRSRSTDPVTSVDAGRDADLADSQKEVLAAFSTNQFESRVLADHELVALLNASGTAYTPQRIRSARSELAERGLLRCLDGVYRKSPTGRRARVWLLNREGAAPWD